jgi:DNA-binding transcriptional regulator YbjK
MKARSLTSYFPSEKSLLIKKVDTHFKEIEPELLNDFISDLEKYSYQSFKEIKKILNQDGKYQPNQVPK